MIDVDIWPDTYILTMVDASQSKESTHQECGSSSEAEGGGGGGWGVGGGGG